MKFYYTTTTYAPAEGGSVRQEPSKSLGGFRSVTPVPSGDLNNLFGDLSEYTIQQTKDEFIGLILKNETLTDIPDINLWIDSAVDAYCLFEIAVVTLSIDVNGNLYMENIPNFNSAPYIADFHSADTEANKVSIGGLDSLDEVGVWIKRKINSAAITSDRELAIYKDTPNDHLWKQKELSIKDDIVLSLEWS